MPGTPPKNSSSLARWAPTNSGKNLHMPISGMMPIWQNAGTNSARSEAHTRSDASASANAPPTAYPSTMAITGLAIERTVRTTSR